MRKWKKERQAADALVAGDPARAIEAYTRAIEAAPERERAELLDRRAGALDAVGRTGEAENDRRGALALLERALAARPAPEGEIKGLGAWAITDDRFALLLRRADVHGGLGDDTAQRADLDEARSLLDRELAVCDNQMRQVALLQHRAELSEHSGDEDAAVRDWLLAADALEQTLPAAGLVGAALAGGAGGAALGLESASVARSYTKKVVHQAAEAARQELIAAGRVVAIGDCDTCGPVVLSSAGLDPAGHRVARAQLVARGRAEGALAALKGGAVADAVADSTPAGWYPDPHRRHEHRYWDGSRWTEHVADRGAASTDPVAA